MTPTSRPILVVLSLWLAGCSSPKLERLARTAASGLMNTDKITVSAEFCAPAPERLIRNRVKFIFLVDRSGSNIGVPATPGSPGILGTDPTRSRRFDPLKNLTQRFAGNPNFEFALITFNESARVVSPFTGDAASFLTVLDSESGAASDQGLTNFTDTIDNAKLLVANDVLMERARDLNSLISYVVFLISDGRPTAGGTTSDEVLDSVDRLVALSAANVDVVAEIQINTVYYFNPPANTDEVSLMKLIADRGHGEARVFGEEVDFSTFDLDETVVQSPFFDAFVTNRSAVWRGGSYLWDQDRDGISNEEEAELGSNPTLPDSDENGMSDGEEMRTMGRPCRDAACEIARAERFPQCRSFDGTSLDTDRDRLSDCLEARIVGSDPKNRDTNGDGVPDDLEFRNSLSVIPGKSDALSGANPDGKRLYDAVKLNYPLRASASTIVGFVPNEYKMSRLPKQGDRDCYALVINNVSVVGDDANEIQLDLVFRTSIVMQSQVIRRGTKRVNGNIVEFTNADFY